MGDTGVKGLLAITGVFVGHEHRAAPFAAKTKALTQAQRLQDDGRGNANGGIGGYKANTHCGNAHDEHCENEHALAAQLVAVMAEDKAAKGACKIADGKGAVGHDGADERVGGGEVELVEHNARHHAVEEKVVPFNGGAKQAGNYDLAHFFFGRNVFLL